MALSTGLPEGVTMADYLARIAAARSTLTAAAITEVEQDIVDHARS